VVSKFQLGDSVHALDDFANCLHRSEYGISPLT